MQQFFIENLDEPKLSRGQLHQINTVLKMRYTEKMRLVDRRGRGVIASATDETFSGFVVHEEIKWHTKKYPLRIIASLIRSERLEWMIQKACEAGVDEIVLYRADRGVVRDFGSRVDRKLDRFNLIAKEASEQSFRQFPVTVKGIIDTTEVSDYISDYNVFCDTTEHPFLVQEIEKNSGSVTAIIGPEGGLSDNERLQFINFGFKPVSLGPWIYRAETAPIALATVVNVLEMK